MTFALSDFGFIQLEVSCMKLRDHPLLSYKGISSWPPTWLWGGGDRYVHAIGEMGVLKDVFLCSVEPYEKCFLIMEHEGRKYIGTLLLRDPTFCEEIYAVLIERRGTAIQEIGEIELDYMLNKQQ
jgi:hypothetical protein